MNIFRDLFFSITILIVFSLSVNTSIIAQRPADNFERRVHHFVNDSVQYRLFIPSDSLMSNLYPLILTAHGSGQMGDDNNNHIIEHRIAEVWAEDTVQIKYPSFICSPQFPQRSNFDDYFQYTWLPSINSLLDSLINEFPIDTNRIYMTGLSMGAIFAWEAVYNSMINRFAAVIPLSGGLPSLETPIITDVPFWAFCGALDELEYNVRQTISYVNAAGYDVEKIYSKYGNTFSIDPVDVGLSIDEIDQLNQNGMTQIYTEYSDGGHLIWTKTYNNPALHYWLFSQQRNVTGREINTQVISSEVNPKYIPIEGDTIKIISEILNLENNALFVDAYVESWNSKFKDSIQLYDDGLHDDTLASDNIFGNYLPLSNLDEGFFNITIRATDLNEPRDIFSARKRYFTTAGPVVLDSFSVFVSQDTIVGLMDMKLRNMSKKFTIENVTAKIQTADTNVISIPRAELSFSDILPNETKERNSGWMYFYTKNNPSQIKFMMEIRSNSYPFWQDTLIVDLNPTNIENESSTLPVNYILNQNYPNPFNPTTTIKYSIPKQSSVTLKVYDLLGSELTTIVNKVQPKGSYEIEFEASELTSGIYFYRLQAGDFVETKKMILLK